MSEKIIMKTWREMEDLLEIAQPGDMIEFNRGYYSHWGFFMVKERIFLYKNKNTSFHFQMSKKIVMSNSY